jgi:hypothetical protein
MGKGKKKAEPPSKVRNGGASTSASSSATSSTTTTLTKKEERKMKMMLKKQRHKDRDYSSKEEVEFNETLASLELRVKYVSGDGNCLFRSFADQLTGLETNHFEFRKTVMDYIEQHAEHFSLFMEDDEPFDDYVERMRNPCEWGGHQELYAASQVLGVNIVVHQVNAARFILNSEMPAARDIHLSYHGEVHYNSVRSIHDPDIPNQPAMEINLNRGISSASEKMNTSSSNSSSTSSSRYDRAVDIVQNALPYLDMTDIQRALELVDNNVDDAIELLISSGNYDDQPVEQSTAIVAINGCASSSAADTPPPPPSSSSALAASAVAVVAQAPDDDEEESMVAVGKKKSAKDKYHDTKISKKKPIVPLLSKSMSKKVHLICLNGREYLLIIHF